MKAELIADWRARVADRTLITLPVTAIERILEERDKLLAALKWQQQFSTILPPVAEAIAYAEADADGH